LAPNIAYFKRQFNSDKQQKPLDRMRRIALFSGENSH